MINQIYTTNNNANNAFSVFDRNKNVKDNTLPYAQKTQANKNTQAETTEQKREEKRGNTLGLKIASTALIAGFAVFALMRGLPKGVYKKIDTMFKNIEDKIQSSENSKKITSGSLKILKACKRFLGQTKAAFNVGVLKDTLLLRGIKKSKIFVRPNAWITKQFEKIATRKSMKNYERTFHHIESVVSDYKDINNKLLKNSPEKSITIDGKTKSVKEWINIIDKKTESLQQHYFDNFLQVARRNRLTETKNNFSDLHERIWNMTFKDKHNFKNNKKLYQTFLSENLVANYKIDLANKVNACKKVITNDIDDNYIATKKLINNIETAPKDFETRKTIKQIQKTLNKYKNLKGETENADREKLKIELNKQLKTLSQNIQNYDYSPELQKQAEKYIQNLSKVITESKKGEFQEILTIYKGICPEKYSQIKKNTYKAIKSLNKSINTETDKLFDKLRDIAIGSVPVDVLTILTSLGIVTGGLVKADNNDERLSVSLKYGIPVVGAVLTSVLCTVSLVSGGPAIIIGLISGELIHKLGNFADNTRKKYQENKLSINKIDSYLENKTSNAIKAFETPFPTRTN